MNLDDIRNILLLQAIEENDEAEHFLPAAEKREAATASGAPLAKNVSRAEEDAFLAKRAAWLLRRVRSRFPDTTAWIEERPAGPPFGTISLVLCLAAVVVGFLTNELGPEKRINILSFPLLGILFWSALIYLREIHLFFRRRRPPGAPDWLEWLGERARTSEETAAAPEPTPLEAARLLFAKRWRRLTSPLPAARLKSILHCAAFLLAASAIGGMYVKGLANEYRAVWESTFFTEASQLRPFLEIVLGPAATLSGATLPSDAELTAMRWPAEGENAARWIHWYALTIGLFVLLPRAFLALAWRVRASRLARTLPFREISPPYFERVLSTSTGAALALRIVPYACEPDEEIRRALVRRLEAHFGRSVALHFAPVIPFGEEEEATLPTGSGDEEGAEILPLFHFAATPEAETHLAVYETLTSLAPNPLRFLLLDATSFDRRSAGFSDAETRRAEREAAWERLFAAKEVTFLLFTATPASTSS
ncbi:MAG: DUF2868 domain-containing protein [Verrucomicrobiaceae bacterium]|nr:DUF2868 domain-containing protein [Verrucomicrobiaceae bacterium]